MKYAKLNKQIFGWELVLDLQGCEPSTIRSRSKLIEYAQGVCAVIAMKPFGKPWAERFGLNSAKAAGFSLVQLIETSSITGHFSELWNSAYINIFSCKKFNTKKAKEFTQQFFGAKRCQVRIMIRLKTAR